VLEPYEPDRLTRWNEGCHTATVLWREIQAQGLTHSLTTVQRFVNQLRGEGPPPSGQPRSALTKTQGPPPRQVASLVLRHPDRRSDEQCAYLQQLRAADPVIATATDLAGDFLAMLRHREGERFPAWLDAAEASGIDELKPRHDIRHAGQQHRWPMTR